MNPLVGTVVDSLIQHGVELGDQLIRKGADLIRQSLSGEVSDEAILEWLREAQTVTTGGNR